MKFDHLVEINDPRDPLIDPLGRTQLWRGLVLRAESPTLFMPHLDACEIINRTEGTVERALRYGEIVIHDVVTYTPEERVQYDVPAQTDISASRLLMTIEEPDEGRLFVRFSYDDGLLEASGSMDAFYNDFRRSAYQEADIDTVRIIRQLVAEGRFDLPLA